MPQLPEFLALEQQDALAAGVRAVEQIESMIRQLEYLRTTQLATLSRLATRIAHDEGHPDRGEHVHRAIEAEVAVATRTSSALVSARMTHAEQLLDGYPAVSAAFASGWLSLRHTEVLADAGQVIASAAVRARYEADVLPLALTMTPTQLRSHARRLAERYAERTLDERHADARTQRHVRVTPLDDGMAQLVAVLGAAEAYAIKDQLVRLARAAEEKGETHDDAPRSRAQVQADLFVRLLLGGPAERTEGDEHDGRAQDDVASADLPHEPHSHEALPSTSLR